MALASSFCSIAFQRQDKWKPNPVVQMPLTAVVDRVAAAGYAGIEIWEPHYGSLNEHGRARARQRMADAGLVVPMLSSYYNFTKSPEHARDSLANGHRVLAEAVELGARNLRLFTGNHRSADASQTQWLRTRDCLRELCDAAASHNIGLCLETHDWNLMDTVPGTLRLLELVDRPNLGLIFQPSTFGNQYRWALEQLAPWTRHVHATNNGLLGQGKMDYEAILSRLLARGVSGYVSVEWMGASPERVCAIDGPWLNRLLTRIGAKAH